MSIDGMTLVETKFDMEIPPEVTPSPFIEGTNIQYAWDATSLEPLKRCARLYRYTIIDGYRSKKDNANLRYGSEFHTSMHQYELLKADGLEHDECVFHVVRDLLFRTDDFRPDDKYKNRPSLVTAVISYLEKYKDDKAETLILENGKPAVELSFRFELDYGPTPDQPYVLCGHLDRVVEFSGEQFIMDYKTTTTTPSDYYWKQFSPHNQMSLYTLASRVVFNAPVKGVIINAIQVKVDSVTCVRGTTYRTSDQQDEWLADLQFWLRLAEEYAKNDYWPMNDTACDKYGGCRFREVCSKSPSVRQMYLDEDFTKEEPWNPLKPR